VTKQQKQFVDQGFERDRLDYWAMRDELLAKYAGKWVAVHKGRVIAVADEPVSLMDQALADDGYAYTNKVGEEDKIVIRQRRVSFPYDTTYSPTPLPRLAAVLYNFAQTKSKVVNDAVPDTGADVTCLPMNDCQDLDVLLFPFYTGISHPFAGVRRSVTFYGARVEVDGKVYNAIVEPVAAAERLLGRDVLNRMKVTFDGPSLTTIVD
jgi:predicted aspartyl protease